MCVCMSYRFNLNDYPFLSYRGLLFLSYGFLGGLVNSVDEKFAPTKRFEFDSNNR